MLAASGWAAPGWTALGPIAEFAVGKGPERLAWKQLEPYFARRKPAPNFPS